VRSVQDAVGRESVQEAVGLESVHEAFGAFVESVHDAAEAPAGTERARSMTAKVSLGIGLAAFRSRVTTRL
jgi:hypothetical protein